MLGKAINTALEEWEKDFLKRAAREIVREVRLEMSRSERQAKEICFTEEEAAKKLGFENKETLARIRREKGIEYCRLQGSRQGIRYTAAQLEDYVKKHTVRFGESKLYKVEFGRKAG